MGRPLLPNLLHIVWRDVPKFICQWSWRFWGIPKNMKNLIGLFEAICDTYDRQDLKPLEDGTTYCNVAVAAVADAMGCKTLDFKTADEILVYISANPDWMEIPIEKAQETANQGSLVIVGLSSEALKQGHGHVCVIRPGIPCHSGKWGAVPRCLNVGSEMFLARAKRGPLTGMAAGVNEAFIPLPKFFVWRPSL